ncbi:MAG: hypothetical protein IJS47_02915 [Clostridia bacterium]|nr:hypothetical protein [Clostridia bacterium]
MELIYLLEKPEEDRVNEIIKKVGQENLFFYSAFDFDEKTNIERFCKVFKSGTLKEASSFLRNEVKLDKTNILIKNFERLFSKSDTSIIDFVFSLKDTNAKIYLLSKDTDKANDLIENYLKDVITKVDKEKRINFFDNITKKQESFVYYSIFGTNSRYIKSIDNTKSIKENIINLILKKDAEFRNEPERIMKEDLRTLSVYNKILMVIAKGADTLNTIAEKMDMTTSTCNKYLNVLVSQKVLRKEKSLYETDTKQSKYIIDNNLFRFYYYFIPDNANILELEKYEDVYNNIEENFDKFLQKTFVDICGDYISKLADENKIKLDIKEEGAFWDKQSKIDLIKGDSLTSCVADCYYREDLVGIKAFEMLKNNAKKLDVADRKYYLFSKNGFTEDLKKLAKNSDELNLVTFDEMFESKEQKSKRLFFFNKKG